MPSLYDSVLLANACYKDEHPLPTGWVLLSDSNNLDFGVTHGYRGKVFFNLDLTEIAVVHRGTSLTNEHGSFDNTRVAGSNLMSDTTLAFHKIPSETYLAVKFLWNFFQKFSSYTGCNKFFQIGHSLGGFHAHICGYVEKHTVIAFDPPGSRWNIQKLMGDDHQLDQDQLKRSFSFFIGYNAINSVNDHVGNLYVSKPGSIKNFSTSASITQLDAHKLVRFREFISKDTPDPTVNIPSDLFVPAKEYLNGESVMQNIQGQQKSRVNSNYKFDENQWVVSIINAGSKIGGHAVLLVEGLQSIVGASNFRRFVGQYDITVYTPENNASSFFSTLNNLQGIVSKVRIHEDSNYTHPLGDDFYGKQARSYHVLVENVKAMIVSIKEDNDQTEAANRGEEGVQHIAFQLFGSAGGLLQDLFSDPQGGLNCAEWCVQKLSVAGIQLDVKPKPERVAGGCKIL